MNVNSTPDYSNLTLDQKMSEIFEADRSRQSLLVGEKIMECVRKYGLGLQQIEIGLRGKNCFTYLIARKGTSSLGVGDSISIKFPDRKKKTHHMFLSTQDPQFVYAEMLQESHSYEENFLKLRYTGFLEVKRSVPFLDAFNWGSIVESKFKFNDKVDVQDIVEEFNRRFTHPKRDSNI